ncbi:Stress-response A/B barrel domain-containing protein HS1, partial [Lachnellula cervina]
MNRQRLLKSTLITIGIISLIALFTIFNLPSSNPSLTKPDNSSLSNSNMGKIVHIVMFEFNEGVSAEVVDDTCSRLLALKDQCIHPTTNKPYVTAGMGGKENSPEDLSGGLTHIFVLEFESLEDEMYYLKKDPAHLAFVKTLDGLLKKAQVVDFTPGVFQP